VTIKTLVQISLQRIELHTADRRPSMYINVCSRWWVPPGRATGQLILPPAERDFILRGLGGNMISDIYAYNAFHIYEARYFFRKT